MAASDQIDDWVTEYGNMVLSLCLKVIRDRELALDTCQSVWEIVLEKKDSFRSESGPGTWIYAIAYREALRAVKREKTRRYRDKLRQYHGASLRPGDEGESLDNARVYEWLSRTCDTCLSGIVGTLNFKTRIIIVFKYVLNIPFEEISAILGMEPGAVRKAASRGKARLASFFENECGLYANNAHCKCGLEGYLGMTSFRNDIVALRSITAKATKLLASGRTLPPLGYWEKISAECHK